MATDADGNEIDEVVETETAPAEAAPEETTIPKARFDEVISQRNTLSERMEQANQELYNTNLRLAQLQARLDAESAARTQAGTQPKTPEEVSRKAAEEKFEELISRGTAKVVGQKFSELEAKFAPMYEMVEQSQRAVFYNSPGVVNLSDELKNNAERLFMQYKATPGVTRDIALTLAKGFAFDKQQAVATSAAAATKTAVSKVNAAATTGAAPTTSVSSKTAPKTKTKSAAELDAELLDLASRGYK